jgi:hypothetical protein
VAGFKVANVFPDFDSTHCPSISIFWVGATFGGATRGFGFSATAVMAAPFGGERIPASGVRR